MSEIEWWRDEMEDRVKRVDDLDEVACVRVVVGNLVVGVGDRVVTSHDFGDELPHDLATSGPQGAYPFVEQVTTSKRRKEKRKKREIEKTHKKKKKEKEKKRKKRKEKCPNREKRKECPACVCLL